MPKSVSLFIPCLVDQLYPEIGIALVNILRHFDYKVSYNAQGVCCGQPAFNAGHLCEAREVAKTFLASLPAEGDIVCPSGSCTAMVRNFYPELFLESDEAAAAKCAAPRVFEFSEFLVKENLVDAIDGHFRGKVSFHSSCHTVRELRVRDQIDAILSRIQGFQNVTPTGEPVCCGFGGLFSVKFDAIAQGMAKSRLEALCDATPDYIVSNDPGCIMHMKKEALRNKLDVQILHFTEFVSRSMNLSSSL